MAELINRLMADSLCLCQFTLSPQDLAKCFSFFLNSFCSPSTDEKFILKVTANDLTIIQIGESRFITCTFRRNVFSVFTMQTRTEIVAEFPICPLLNFLSSVPPAEPNEIHQVSFRVTADPLGAFVLFIHVDSVSSFQKCYFRCVERIEGSAVNTSSPRFRLLNFPLPKLPYSIGLSYRFFRLIFSYLGGLDLKVTGPKQLRFFSSQYPQDPPSFEFNDFLDLNDSTSQPFTVPSFVPCPLVSHWPVCVPGDPNSSALVLIRFDSEKGAPVHTTLDLSAQFARFLCQDSVFVTLVHSTQ